MKTHHSVLTIQNLHFGYAKKQLVLHQLNMEVPEASIYGFLGANGAGKSTTIRTILGLLKPQSGQVQLFGQDVRAHRLSVLKRVGALIESPSLYQHLNGRDNLAIACQYLNLPKARIGEVLELVNLRQAATKKVKEYSTGMKQRLGLAMALLSDPELLILDEPVNGLDPSGIIEIRNIIQELHSRGKTIFLSSHILSEIEKIATRVGIIKNGKMVFQGTVSELEQLKASNLSIKMTVADTAKVADVLNGASTYHIGDKHLLELSLEDRDQLPGLIRQLVDGGIELYEVIPQRNDLEKLFINLTSTPTS
jgi:ABC-type multidrug transport system ATPase subunit